MSEKGEHMFSSRDRAVCPSKMTTVKMGIGRGGKVAQYFLELVVNQRCGRRVVVDDGR